MHSKLSTVESTNSMISSIAWVKVCVKSEKKHEGGMGNFFLAQGAPLLPFLTGFIPSPPPRPCSHVREVSFHVIHYTLKCVFVTLKIVENS